MIKYTTAFSGFSVKDIKESKDFYENKLGLEVKERPEGLSLHTNGAGNVFMYPKEDHMPATYTVLNFIVENVESVVDGLIAKGIVMEQYDMEEMKTNEKGIVNNPTDMGPKSMAWFKDPSGNIIGVMQEK